MTRCRLDTHAANRDVNRVQGCGEIKMTNPNLKVTLSQGVQNFKCCYGGIVMYLVGHGFDWVNDTSPPVPESKVN